MTVKRSSRRPGKFGEEQQDKDSLQPPQSFRHSILSSDRSTREVTKDNSNTTKSHYPITVEAKSANALPSTMAKAENDLQPTRGAPLSTESRLYPNVSSLATTNDAVSASSNHKEFVEKTNKRMGISTTSGTLKEAPMKKKNATSQAGLKQWPATSTTGTIAMIPDSSLEKGNALTHNERVSKDQAIKSLQMLPPNELQRGTPGAVVVPGIAADQQRGCPPPVMGGSFMDPNYESSLDGFSSSDSEKNSTDDHIISATKVSVEVAEAVSENKLRRRRRILVALAAGLSIGTIVGLAVGLTRDDDQVIVSGSTGIPTPSPTETFRPTLERIVEANVLRCGVSDRFGFGLLNEETGMREGYEVDLCRAVAAAVFGDPDRIETTVTASADRFLALQNRSIDLQARTTTFTMERDVFEKNARAGFSFSVPHLYDGLAFGGIPPFGSCADNLQTTSQCDGLKICTLERSSHFDILSDLLPTSTLFIINSTYSRLEGFIDGACNVIAGESNDISPVTVRSAGYDGPYEIGNNVLSKEPNAMATRDDDPQFSDFVNWVFQGLVIAEAKGITQATASSFGLTALFAREFESMFVNAIASVGNYGELYARHLQSIVPRQGLNMVNLNGDSGLIYSLPFGGILNAGPGPLEGRTLNRIVDRGSLKCGISVREGFGEFNSTTGEWTGMDTDYCRALSAAVFSGVVGTTEFVELADTSDRFTALSSGVVDVLTSAPINFASDVQEPNAGQGFSFSQPYFYDPINVGIDMFETTLALAMREDDSQWSSFVYWVVAATFFAEEKGYNRLLSNQMPVVNSFGESFSRMFRDAVLVSGNYGEIYARNLEALIPRSGRNLLNTNPVGPQHYPVPGL